MGGKCGDGVVEPVKIEVRSLWILSEKKLQKIVEESSNYLMMAMKEQRFCGVSDLLHARVFLDCEDSMI